MIRPNSLEALRGYVSAQMRSGSVAEGEEELGDRRPFVTLSRQAGAGGRTAAAALAELLTNQGVGSTRAPWTVFDRNLLEVVTEEHHIPESLIRDVEKLDLTGVQAVVEEMFGVQPSALALVRKTSRTILGLARMGNAIIVGRAGNLVTRRLPFGLRVRLVGSPEQCLARMMRYYRLDRTAAAGLMAREDAGRRQFVRRYFRKSIADPLLYDLVVNTDDLAPTDAATLIAESLRIRQSAPART
jgi:cytidylate kinase